ncbi:hypothetical protein GCM10009753_16930 [Streptantibioticus ferralitis]
MVRTATAVGLPGRGFGAGGGGGAWPPVRVGGYPPRRGPAVAQPPQPSRARPIEEVPPDVFSTVLRIMLEAPFRLVRGALPHMYAQRWGRIVNVSSAHGLRASAYKSAYVAAKHGLEGFSKVTALEGAAHGVTSNWVSPGYVRTPRVQRQTADRRGPRHHRG